MRRDQRSRISVENPAPLFWYLMHMATCDIAFHQGCSTG